MSAVIDYGSFLEAKSQGGGDHGFQPRALPPFLFDFQAHLVEWALRKGRSGIFADCGLGKGPMLLSWADAIVQRENRHVIVMAPLAVSSQLVREAEKFGIPAVRCVDGKLPAGASVVITNYERLHYFTSSDFIGAVCDESSILKSFDGARQSEITEFMKKLPYRLLATATAAPNDYIELGTSSQALGELGFTDVLNRFFKNDLNNSATGRMRGEVIKWRFKGHAEKPFWRWVSSWARALRKPSDLGFADDRFVLPPLIEVEHVVEAKRLAEGMLFALPAVGLKEQREERRRTIIERCEYVASLTADTGQPALVWCHLNPEGDLLEKLIPGAVQVSGRDSDDAKEEKLMAFASGEARVLVTKPKIGAWGLNFQHCAHVTVFPSHSFEQYYQGVRRCWRFGQQRPVRVDIVASDGESGVKANMQRKALAANRMFDALVAHMHNAVTIQRGRAHTVAQELPTWL
jgi:hypothetical protein